MTDVLAFIGFVLLTATGVLMRYSLPPGSGKSRTIWGLDRHDWGGIHFWIAVGFFSILSINLFLHGRWIGHVLRGRKKQNFTTRIALGVVAGLALLALGISPLLSPVIKDESYPHEHREGYSNPKNNYVNINGRMTLEEIENVTGVPAEYIILKLGLPSNTTKEKKLGQLRQYYPFEMKDIRKIIKNYKEN